ncbi:DUF2975 domain-containing protein [Bacteroides oleiciplenus]|uniref:DUF2975 domain-containing protein n=2 Tax=Bacteroides oleiciplenus TaxID=626931 RepID=K9DWQ2_9BACE|nr:DUF2975 domain-containing protein [Bacteroides oleiciplenus]EKU87681.1 hypothetical protein HMPREF9447_05140 [Bacteroides oleiciplenus YIT 12058]RGN34294.1 DUF2975 domain-containing protein [Bacteroides oleiciplenus]
MKRRLNILCVIVLFVLGYSVLETTYYVGMGIKAGIEKGFDSKIDVKEREEMTNLQVVQLVPKDLGGAILIDSVYNEKSGEYVPAAYGQMIVSVNTQPSVLSRIISFLILIADYVAIVWAVVLFIRLIVSINKSDIFNWKNVRRLRRLGVLLIISFACTFFTAFLSFYNVGKVFSVTGYSLSMADMVHITSLVLGLSALIVAEVFAIGLRMKEEQDLTI